MPAIRNPSEIHELARYEIRPEALDDQLRDLPTGAWSLATEVAAWKRARARVDQLARMAQSQGEPYPEAERLWLADTKRLAIYVSAVHDAMQGFGDDLADQAARRRRP